MFIKLISAISREMCYTVFCFLAFCKSKLQALQLSQSAVVRLDHWLYELTMLVAWGQYIKYRNSYTIELFTSHYMCKVMYCYCQKHLYHELHELWPLWLHVPKFVWQPFTAVQPTLNNIYTSDVMAFLYQREDVHKLDQGIQCWGYSFIDIRVRSLQGDIKAWWLWCNLNSLVMWCSNCWTLVRSPEQI